MMMFLATVLSMQTGLAQPVSGGVVVRLEPGGQVVTAPPRVILAPVVGGDPVSLTLRDDGQAPDVAAQDGRWAGFVNVAAESVVVTVEVDGDRRDGGTVSWAPTAQARDLILTLNWSGVTALASTMDGAEPIEAREATVKTVGVPKASSVPAASSQSIVGHPVAWATTGAGLLCILVGFGLAVRNARPPLPPLSLRRVEEPPILGVGTPALHQGLSVWQVAPEDRASLTKGLLRTLARQHRVLLRLPDGVAEPTTLGGPAYVTTTTVRKVLEDHLVELFDRPGLPVVVLYVGGAVSEQSVVDLRDILEPDIGGILLAETLPPAVQAEATLRTTEGGAVLATATESIHLTLGAQGFVRAPATEA
ncbi:MAG: hypothetical protein CL927_10500 [Deltaproteobacteria bacterium]|nr:hypothetical protein [Deltaproteobacteria bacterium]